MVSDKVVAIRVKEYREAPGVFEGHKVRFAWVEVEVHDFERADLLLSHLRAFQTFSEGSRRYCCKSMCALQLFSGAFIRVVHIRNAPLYLRRSKSAIMQSIMCGFGVRK